MEPMEVHSCKVKGLKVNGLYILTVGKQFIAGSLSKENAEHLARLYNAEQDFKASGCIYTVTPPEPEYDA